MAKTLTIIVPAYNEEPCVDAFVEEVQRVFSNWKGQSKPEYKILFVDDGSSDGTLSKLQNQSKTNEHVFYISFSRNFGKEAAIFAGINESVRAFKSDYYVLMDADLQDPPALLPEMFEYIETHDDIDRVGTRRCTRKGEPPIRSFFARRFYKLMNRTSEIKLVDGARDYQLMTSNYAKAILRCCEYNRFFKGLSQWVGFKTHWLEYENIERTKGETKWSFWSLLGYSIEGMVAYSTWPLRMISVAGIFLSFVSLVMLIVVFVRAIVQGDPVAGWPSLVCIILLLGGLMFTGFGILGLYLEKTYLEVKGRPLYILSRSNLDQENVESAH